MDPIKLQMKLTRKNSFSVGGNEGISFRFQEWDYRHDATLMLKRNGEAVDNLRRDPLFKMQDVEVGEMCDVEFVPFQDRRQESRDGQRDSVKDVIGLRLHSVRPAAGSDPVRNGQAGKVTA